MLKDFKEFVMRGNILDMAVGIIIGIAFGAVITSLVNDVIMPPIGLALGKVDFANMFVNLSGTAFTTVADAKKAGAPIIGYGLFVNAIINFVIVAFVVFLMVRSISKVAKKPAPAPAPAAPTTKDCPYCFSAISKKATRCPQCTSDVSKSS